MKAVLLFFLLALAPFAQAQPRPDLTPSQAYDLRNQSDDRRPRWCQMYDRQDYYRELRACGDDRRCRWDAKRKAERCGLR